jgi:hypothetical protein
LRGVFEKRSFRPVLPSNIQKNTFVSAGAFFLLFLISLIFFLKDGRTLINCIIFFPEPAYGDVTGEPRRVYRQETLEKNVLFLVREMVLGPMDIRHTNMFPRNTRIRSVFVRGAAAYLDFSPDIIFLGSEVKMSFDELLAAIRKTVLFNFRQLSDVIITVEGQLPGAAPYFPPAD